MSLRLRLLTGMATLVFVGLVVFGTTTYLSVEHILLHRLDGQLTDAVTGLTKTGAAQAVGRGIPPGQGGGGNGGPGNGGPPRGSPEDELAARNAAGPELFVEFLTPGGAVWEPFPAEKASGGVAPGLSPGVLARVAGYRPPLSGPGAPPPVVVGPFSARPAAGGAVERVAVALPPNGGGVVAAASLKPIRDTLRGLLEVEVGVGVAVLALTLGLGLALARQAARPLEEIAATADAIAAGDLDRRVPAPARPPGSRPLRWPGERAGRERSETGRVALAFNTMLGRIQEAFARRDATEARLRTFVADASHELSTPLTSIRGYAELFHRGLQSRPADLAKALERIEQEATRMGVLVDELLTLASFDAGRALGQDPVDLRSIAADAAADLRAVDPGRPVILEAAQPVIVVGDESRLRQVAGNLVSNVRRHTPEGTEVAVRAHRENGVGILEVADRGPGMTAEQAAKVFDRFYRVDKARSRAMGGAGLGLAIVASIAEAHGGRASVSTAPGQGATFSVAIPLAEAPEQE